jgi:Rieske Fe-S protein
MNKTIINETEGRDDSETNNSRREFLKASGVVVALAMTGGTVLSGEALAQRGADHDPFQALGKGSIDLGLVSSFKLNTMTDKISSAGVLISRTSDGLIALSSHCTHEGCDVHWQSDAKTLQCPCHRAEFSSAGDALRRPAREPLPRYPLTVKSERLMVDTNTLIRRSSVAKTDFLKVK